MAESHWTDEERWMQDKLLEKTLEGMGEAYNEYLEDMIWEDEDEEPARKKQIRRPSKKREPVPKPVLPCDGCKEVKKFSFDGCMINCRKFMDHLKKIADSQRSPCRDFRCGVPGVSSRNRTRCEGCPILRAYDKSLGKKAKGPKCKLGEEHTPYTPPWEYKYDPFVKR
jgi:hypothetical protein